MRHLSLCTGYGGIDLALQEALGAETVAVADVDPGACKILAHRYPEVPNLGNIASVDWSPWRGQVEVLSGGTPCQDLSTAGRRAGMTEGTRSNLWAAMREAIAGVRPQLVVWENVRGAYSAHADSAMEYCEGCLGALPRSAKGRVLRALGRVLGDLADLGYDALWYGLRASDVGAAHRRYRVFVFAWRRDAESDVRWLLNHNEPASLPDALGGRHNGRLTALVKMFPTPRTSDANGVGGHCEGGPDLRTAVPYLLPTPNSYAASRGGPQDPRKRKAGGHSTELDDVVSFLPTLRVKNNESWQSAVDWREYEPAIRRQEAAFGRSAPRPTEPGRTGNPRLAPRFSEWLMGSPEGWVTDVPDLTRAEKLKALGNGVVPQQCAAAARRFIHDFDAEVL